MGLLVPVIGVMMALVGTVPAEAVQPVAPNPQIAEPFQAPLCEGATRFDPLHPMNDPISDLSEVFGQRLTDYNAGKMVMLYANSGMNVDGEVPVCGTRYEAELGGPVSEWLYCTDIHSLTCSATDAEGRLVEGDVVVDGLLDLDGNPRLDASQERLIRHILTTDLTVMVNGSPLVIGNANGESRTYRQWSVWCVSDPDGGDFDLLQAFCAANFTDAQKQAMLDALPADPFFEPTLSAASSEASIGIDDTVEVTLTTNLFGTPITIDAPGATVSVCPASQGTANIADGVLLISSGDAAQATVSLCVSWQEAGTHAIGFSALPETLSSEALGWVQSPSIVDGKPCQVFSNFRSQVTDVLTAGLTVAVEYPVVPVEPATPVIPGGSSEPSSPTAPAVGVAPSAEGQESVQQLARTGSTAPVWAGLVAAMLLTTGSGVWIAHRRRTVRG